MGRSACLHANRARWKRLKKGEQLRALDGFVEDDPAILGNAVYLKYILGQIQAYGIVSQDLV